MLIYRRYLKGKNYSEHTAKNYLHRLQQFIGWIAVPIEQVVRQDVKLYVGFLMEKGMTAAALTAIFPLSVVFMIIFVMRKIYA